MFVATATVSVLLAALMAYSAVRKLSHQQQVVRSYARAGVPEERLNLLAAVLLVGAAGLLAGLAWAPLGVLAGIGAVGYFIVAIGSHLRHGDLRNLPAPVVLAVLAVAALVLRVATA